MSGYDGHQLILRVEFTGNMTAIVLPLGIGNVPVYTQLHITDTYTLTYTSM